MTVWEMRQDMRHALARADEARDEGDLEAVELWDTIAVQRMQAIAEAIQAAELSSHLTRRPQPRRVRP